MLDNPRNHNTFAATQKCQLSTSKQAGTDGINDLLQERTEQLEESKIRNKNIENDRNQLEETVERLGMASPKYRTSPSQMEADILKL